jgi:ribose 5-phosphate isomerase A
MRMLKESYYPYVTENGNFILDTIFDLLADIRRQEVGLKNIAGVVEVGLFTKHAEVYYKAKEDSSFF